MTVMLAFVNGMYALTKGSTVPGNVMVLADGATDEVFSDWATATSTLWPPAVRQENQAWCRATGKTRCRW